MGAQLYNLINSSVFWVVAILCFIILVIWKEKWLAVLTRTVNLLGKPLIFRTDPEPKSVPTYPRELLEDSSTSFRSALTQPLQNLINAFHEWLSNLVKLIYNPDHPFRTIGYALLLMFFVLLIYSDAVAIANTLLVLGLSTNISPLLADFDIAVFAGSLIALILGFAFWFETQSTNSEFTAMSDRDPKIRKAMSALALFVCLLSVISLAAWGLARLGVAENINNSALNLFVTFVVVFVVPFNSALAAAMIFNEAIRGLVLVFVTIGYLIEGVLRILNFLLTLLSSLFPYLFDILYRLMGATLQL